MMIFCLLQLNSQSQGTILGGFGTRGLARFCMAPGHGPCPAAADAEARGNIVSAVLKPRSEILD